MAIGFKRLGAATLLCAGLCAGAVSAAPLSAQEDTARVQELCEQYGDPVDPSAEPVVATGAFYEEGMEIPERSPKMTPRLEDLLQRDDTRREVHDTPIARLDFDWVVNGQDALISNVKIIGRLPDRLRLEDESEQMVVTACFDNFGQPQVLDYYWQKAEDGWQLDDVVSRTPGFTWVLSLLLEYGW